MKYKCEEEAVSESENKEEKTAEKPENTSEESENVENTQCGGLDKNTIRGYKAGLSADTRAVERLISENNFRAARTKLEGMINTLNRIIDAEEVDD